MPYKKIFHISKRTIKTVVVSIEIFLALVIVLLGLLFWRLSVEPLNLDFLVPELTHYFIPKESGLTIRTDRIYLKAEKRKSGLLHIDIEGLTVLKENGSVLLDLPHVEISYGLRHLLAFNYMPTNVMIQKAVLRAIINPDGRILIQDKAIHDHLLADDHTTSTSETPLIQEARQTAMEAVKGLDQIEQKIKEPLVQKETKSVSEGILVQDVDQLIHFLQEFGRLELDQATIVLDDQKFNRQIVFPQIDLLWSREGFRNRVLRSDIKILLDQEEIEMTLNARLNRFTRKGSFEVTFQQLDLSHLVRLDPLFRDLQLVLKGRVEGEIDLSQGMEQIRKGLTALTVQIESQKGGTVNLPAPLTNMYPVKSLLLKGEGTSGLESFQLKQSRIELATGINATVQLDVDGLGSFLDTGDLSQIKSVLKARVLSVPMEEVPSVWPSALGPDAHEWVRKNLSKGEAPVSDFTLYFQGAELVDLFGKVSFEGVSVRFLEEMPVVEKTGGTVLLYPDKVEIFANTGLLKDTRLVKADVLLTELQEDISKANITLETAGPVSDAIELISYPPLEFAQEFGLSAKQVGGTGTVSLNLKFPLIEALTPDQVRVFVDAHIQDGVFPTPLPDTAVEQGDFSLTVQNKGLQLKGTAMIKSIPVELSWNETFQKTADSTIQSLYELKGTLDHEQLKQLVPESDGYYEGSFNLQTKIMKDFQHRTTIEGQADLTKGVLRLYPISYTKDKGVSGILLFKATLSDQNKLEEFSARLTADQEAVIVDAGLDLRENFLLSLHEVKAPFNQLSGSFLRKNDGSMKLQLKGKSLNLTDLFDMPCLKSAPENDKEETDGVSQIPNVQIAPPDFEADIALDQLLMAENKPLKNVVLKLNRQGYFWKEFIVETDAKSPLRIVYEQGRKMLTGSTDNLGDLLSRLGVTERFFGGKLNIQAIQPSSGGFHGMIDVRQFDLKDPGFIIQAVTILGIVDGIRGKPLAFKKAQIPFEITPYQTMYLSDSVAYGTTLGLTFRGRIGLSSLDLSGSVIPAYAINSLPGRLPVIGGLFKDGVGGGLVGVKYEVKGTPSHPQVQFNPLTSIAPGILGTLFQ